jgi:hypothetical protein
MSKHEAAQVLRDILDGDRAWANGRARILEYLRVEPRCGFEVASDRPPYRGVRGQGVASLHPAEGG